MNIKAPVKSFLNDALQVRQLPLENRAEIAKPVAFGISSNPDIFDESPSRTNYFSGKFLTADSLQAEQNYGNSKRSYSVAELFDPMKSYTAVRMQQGRVVVDSDYNENNKKDKD